MREILFRGKRINNGEWVEGYLVGSYLGSFWIDNTAKSGVAELPLIRPETVGQYTGLNDKNGVLIFEGDILKVTWGDASGKPLVSYLIVVFENGAFTTMHTKADTKFGLVSTYTAEQLGCCGVFCEVIGNIWDNPELVEVQHEN